MMLVLSLITRSTFVGILSSFSTSTFMVPFMDIISQRPHSSPSSPITTAPTAISIEQQQSDPNTMPIKSKIVRKKITSHIHQDPTIAGPLLRLAFHDAATREGSTGGPNGSIQYELSWSENRALSRPLQIVQQVYQDIRLPPPSALATVVMSAQTGGDWKMSLADVIALAGAQAVEVAGGPNIPVHLGRPDVILSKEGNAKKEKREEKATITSPAGADPYQRREILQNQTTRSIVSTTLPSAALDSDGLRLYFAALNLTEAETVAISGAHDLGRHVTLLNMTRSCLKNLTRECLEDAPVSVPFVSKDPDTFSNDYYKMLLRWYDRNVTLGEVAFIPTDVNLVVDEGLRRYVMKYASDQDLFFREFRVAYQKLVDATATSVETY